VSWGGLSGSFPIEFGGAPTSLEAIHQALRSAMGNVPAAIGGIDDLWRIARARGLDNVARLAEHAVVQGLPRFATTGIARWEELLRIPPEGYDEDRRIEIAYQLSAESRGDLPSFEEELRERVSDRLSLVPMTQDLSRTGQFGRAFGEAGAGVAPLKAALFAEPVRITYTRAPGESEIPVTVREGVARLVEDRLSSWDGYDLSDDTTDGFVADVAKAGMTRAYGQRDEPWLIPGCVASYEADLGISAPGGSVTTWSRANGLAGNVLVPMNEGAPTYEADDGDGFPALRFNGTTQGLRNLDWGGEALGVAAFDLDNGHTFAMLVRIGTTDGMVYSIGDYTDGVGREYLRIFGGGANQSGEIDLVQTAPSDGTISRAGFNAGEWAVLMVWRDGLKLHCDINGADDQTVDLDNQDGSRYGVQKLSLGTAIHGGVMSTPFGGRYRAFAAYNRALTADERARLIRWWAAKWPGISL
jgi:hypothetical protein